jgi:hypothetical protein
MYPEPVRGLAGRQQGHPPRVAGASAANSSTLTAQSLILHWNGHQQSLSLSGKRKSRQKET